jgi:hyperosmotically inducible periplasmic protein
MRRNLLTLILTLAVGAVGACTSKSDRADNTKQNMRDKLAVPTADQAAQSGDDLTITQKVRKAIMDDSALSTNAHNVKIIVKQGTVTLTGPVASNDERARVGQLAAAVPGATAIVNELDIAN